MTNEEIKNLIQQASAAEAQGIIDEAERLSRQALAGLSDRVGEEQVDIERSTLQAEAMHMFGLVCVRRGDFHEAQEHLHAALQISQQIDDHVGIARTLGTIGLVLWNLSDYPKALEYLGAALSRNEELGNKLGVAADLDHIGSVYLSLSDFTKAMEFHNKALSIAEEIGDTSGVARFLGNIGNVHLSLSDYAKALEYYRKALSFCEELGNKRGVATNFGNIGILYNDLSDYSKALEYLNNALTIDEELGNKTAVARHLNNIGIIYKALFDYPKAIEYYGRALDIAASVGAKNVMAPCLANLGNLHAQLEDYPKAMEYFSKALTIAEEIGARYGVALSLGSIGRLQMLVSNYALAHENSERALKIHEELGSRGEAANTKASLGELYARDASPFHDAAKAENLLHESIAESRELGLKQYIAHQSLAKLYERQERWQEANQEWKLYHELKDESLSEEAKKSAILLEQRRQIAEREKEIAIAKAASDAKMSATTKLLYKVLPQSVATRMIAGEEEIADYYTSVSILFADIAGFTPISADMPAIVVVRFLNYVFGEFDRIIKKHGCEKIKTIGDGYMAVCGAPVECADHAERLAAAALEMQQTISLPESIAEFMPSGVEFGIRIGLHTGSVVAGVIGEERFVYDIYSDAVNTAARMESHGEENRIHCSNDFYRHLQNRFAMTKNTNHGFVFEKRGEMEIKGKGMMRTYFLEQA